MIENRQGRATRRTFLAGVGTVGALGVVGSAAAKPGNGNGNKNGFPPRGRTTYSNPVPLGDGEVKTFVTTHPGGKLTSVGVELTAATATMDADEYSDMAMTAIDFPSGTPFEYLGLDWMPGGHGPPDVYGVPHFDIHFYLQSQADTGEIPPVNYPPGEGGDPYEHPLAEDQFPAGYFRTNYVIPGMGEHLFDSTSPEWASPGEPSGEDFTHTFVWGHWDGALNFFEPMITTEFFETLEGSTTTAITMPDRMPHAGEYPTEYRVAYHQNRDAYTVTLQTFESFEESAGVN